MQKRAQQSSFGMSFGMIFSIFLIVIFVVIAFVVIKFFINDFSPSAEIGLFKDDLQDAIDNAWKGQSSEFEFKINLPKDIEQICFANLSAQNVDRNLPQYKMIESYELYNDNIFLIPPEKAENFGHWKVEHINITKITKNKNPYCVSTQDSLTIKKDFYDRLVTLE